MIKLSWISSAMQSVRENECALWCFPADARTPGYASYLWANTTARKTGFYWRFINTREKFWGFFWLSEVKKENIIEVQVYLNIVRY